VGAKGPHEVDRTVNRINYGVIFKYAGQIVPTTNLLRHTFKISLPMRRDAEDFKFVEKMDFMNHEKKPCLRELEDRKIEVHSVCQKFLKNIEFLMQISKDGSKQMHGLVEDIYDLVPESTRKGQRQGKRAILGWGGSLLNSIFGVALQDDVDELNKNVLKLTETINKDLGIMKKTITDLSDFAEKTTSRLDALVEQIKENSIQNLKLIETVIYNEDRIVDFLSNITLNSMQLKHMIDTLTIHYTNYLSGLQVLVAGRLSLYLVPKNVLVDTIAAIQDDLQNSESGRNFRIIHKDTDFYYKKGSYVYARDDENLFITLQIPISSFHSNFLLYHVTFHDLAMHDNNKHVIQLEEKIYGLAVSEDKKFYYELSEYELHTVNKYEHSNQKRIFKISQQKSCIMSIYLDDKSGVKNNCQYMITMHDLKPKVEHLYDNVFLLVNISEITYVCDEQEMIQKGCTTCTITLKPRCSIRAGAFYIPEALAARADEEGIKYVTSLPLLMQFFSNESLQNVNGYTAYLNPPIISIPNFKFYESNLSKSFSEDSRKKVNLERAVQSVKTDKVIVNGLSEAIVLGKVLPNSNYWISTPGIVSLVTTGLVIMLILSNLYLLNKLRYLIIAVAVLKSNALQTHANTLQLNYEDQKILQSDIFENEQSIHEMFLEITKQIQPQIVTIILAITLLLLIVYKLYKKLCATNRLEFEFKIEFSTRNDYCYVHILNLSGSIDDYTISAKEFIKDITIEGWLKPVLKYNWSSLTLIDQSTANEFKIKNEIPLSWATGKILRKILQQPFKVNPVFVGNKNLKRVQIIKTGEQLADGVIGTADTPRVNDA